MAIKVPVNISIVIGISEFM